jgi:type II secretory pathway component PulF
MKSEDLAFVNRQLAAMLKSGVPLESGLRQLCSEMRRGELRNELSALESDLSQGTPIDRALSARHLPELYSRMLRAGVQGQDLPRMLTLLADYYYEQHNLWARLKGLMIYPAFVLVGCLCLSTLSGMFFTQLVRQEVQSTSDEILCLLGGASLPSFTAFVLSHRGVLAFAIWTPAFVLAVLLLAIMLALALPGLRRWLRFYIPILRDAGLAQFAGTMGLMLRGGCPLRECVAFIGQLESGNRLGGELKTWETRMQGGAAKFLDIAGGPGLLPPFFKWLVASAGEDLPGGFEQAADLYRTRATRARDFILYAALPVATVVLGTMIAIQVYCLFITVLGLYLPLVSMMDGLGS